MLPAFRAVPAIYTYMLDDLAAQGIARDRPVRWIAAGPVDSSRKPIRYEADAETGGRRHLDEMLGIGLDPEPEELDETVTVSGVPAGLYAWAGMTPAELGIDIDSL